MTPIGEILQSDHVILALGARAKSEAIDEVISALNGDERIKNFEEFASSVQKRNAPAVNEGEWGICLAHGRTEAVTSLVMAVGRSHDGIACQEVPVPVRLVFVAGIPAAFNSDYLRIVGAIARICRDKHQLDRLLTVKTKEDFVHLLQTAEVKL